MRYRSALPTNSTTSFPTPNIPPPLAPPSFSTGAPETEQPPLGFEFFAQMPNHRVQYQSAIPTTTTTSFTTPPLPPPLAPPIVFTGTPETEQPLLGFGFLAQTPNPRVRYRSAVPTTTTTSFPTPKLPPPSPPPSVSTGTCETELPPLGFRFFGPNHQPLHAISIGCPNYHHPLISHTHPTSSVTPATSFHWHTQNQAAAAAQFRSFGPNPQPPHVISIGPLNYPPPHFPHPANPSITPAVRFHSR